jgi:hypothetical protein
MFSMVPLLLLLALSLLATAPFCRVLRLVDQPFQVLGRQRGLAVAVSGLVTLLANVALSVMGQIPQPLVHDEFSYLLQADTFAHGRLANPPHPLWMHFETMHVLQEPTYASKYPPAQGLVLALGQVSCGQPIVGVWLSGALASAALCWMLFAYVPRRWAALGGILAALHPLMFVWSQSYWGGALAAGGGALVLGAAARMQTRPAWPQGVLLGVGLAVLANSRPFEGLILALLVLLPVLRDWCGPRGAGWWIIVRNFMLPASVVLLPVFAWMGYYNWRVTGNPLCMPLIAYADAYDVAPKFVWQSAKPEPLYRHKEMRDLHLGWELPSYEEQQTPPGLATADADKLLTVLERYFPFVIYQLPALTIPWLLARRRMRRTLLQMSLFLLTLLVSEVWLLPHYAAPALGLFMVFTMDGLRLLYSWRRRGRPTGRFLVRASLIMSMVMLTSYCVELSRVHREGWNIDRARIEAQLSQEPGCHLVVVRYGPDHNVHAEWVYNSADIDNAKVVWARAMGERDRELLEYFRGRRVWVLEADAPKASLTPLRFEAEGVGSKQ